MTGRYILNCQLKTPSVSSSQADAFYINMAEEWISYVMILELRNDLRKGSIFLFENVSLKCYYLRADCTSISKITPACKLVSFEELLLNVLGVSTIIGCVYRDHPQPTWTEAEHVVEAAVHLGTRCFRPAVVTGREVSGIITSRRDCTDPPQLLRHAGDD